LTNNFYRAVASVCTIICSVLFWLAGFMVKESMKAFPGQRLPAGEWLVPGILFFAAVPLTVILIKRIVPGFVSSKDGYTLWVNRSPFLILFIAFFLMGLFL
jgi:hypothetical protein